MMNGTLLENDSWRKRLADNQHPMAEKWWVMSRPQPYFAESQTNFTVISGQTAYLNCRVHMLGDKQVSARDSDSLVRAEIYIWIYCRYSQCNACLLHRFEIDF
ncbi:hypothetical protein SK128_019396 [Halocaridina rubra]|uniref:Uncharacterized protein n=1 Tax=Halocaridina rubra TaxID=373956 RepID=A0AAN9AFT1_HALRR